MLAFVLDPQSRALGDVLGALVLCRQQAQHCRIHVLAIREHLLKGGMGQQTSTIPRIRLADPVVIGVEERLVAFVERAVTRGKGFQQKGLEEPTGMREVPFWRTHKRLGL